MRLELYGCESTGQDEGKYSSIHPSIHPSKYVPYAHDDIPKRKAISWARVNAFADTIFFNVFIIKALLHWATFFATWVAILLRYKLQEKLSSVTYPEMNMSRNFFGPAILGEVEVGSTFRNDPRNAATNFSSVA